MVDLLKIKNIKKFRLLMIIMIRLCKKYMVKGLISILILPLILNKYVSYRLKNMGIVFSNVEFRNKTKQMNLHHQNANRYSMFNENMPKLSSYTHIKTSFPYVNRTQIGMMNATFVMLVRNEELSQALMSIRSLEDRFNKNYKYPWVFLNDKKFDPHFIEKTQSIISGQVYYETIPEKDWNPPSFIDEDKLNKNLINSAKTVLYGYSRSYRNMCHFFSGYLHKQKILKKFEWYWRVDTGVRYFCDIQYDVFSFMKKSNKLYGFVITFHENENTITTLWHVVKKFIDSHPHLVNKNSSFNFLTTKEFNLNQNISISGTSVKYNLCHFWSNFEIGNLNFFRGKAYSDFFKFLDSNGGFYYERWGDAPVHTIAVSLLLDKNQIHHFEDIGYYHPPFFTMPHSQNLLLANKCIFDLNVLEDNNTVIDYLKNDVCLKKWWKYGSGKTFLNKFDFKNN